MGVQITVYEKDHGKSIHVYILQIMTFVSVIHFL